jgi:hypothetical protein
MPRLATCRFAELTVRTRDGFTHRFGAGVVADLDAEIAPGLTLADALGEYVSGFHVETTDEDGSAIADDAPQTRQES